MTSYKSRIEDFLQELKDDVSTIFCTYQNDLVIRLEEYNLLQNKYNCLESSTAIGFVLEEFIVAKLAMYTSSKPGIKHIIRREDAATTDLCYDCISDNTSTRFLINIKAQKCELVHYKRKKEPKLKNKSENSAIGALTQIHFSYCKTDPDQEKSLVVLKILYSIENGNDGDLYTREHPRHIHIYSVDAYPIEYYDYSKDHQQDNRKWSNKDGVDSYNNGRLKLTDNFKKSNPLPEDQISYETTKKQIQAIIDKNRDKAKKKMQEDPQI